MMNKNVMVKRTRRFSALVCDWPRARDGVAATEFALIFPVMMMMLVGVYDYGVALVINQKTITASQMLSDLVARNVTVTEEDIDNIIDSGFQAIRPFPVENYGYDIISLRYDGDSADDIEPYVCWRRTANMTASDRPIDNAAPISALGEGLVIATVTYTYRPALTWRFFGTINMSETAFSRGRRSAVVSLQEGVRIGCDDEI